VIFIKGWREEGTLQTVFDGEKAKAIQANRTGGELKKEGLKEYKTLCFIWLDRENNSLGMSAAGFGALLKNSCV